MPAPKLIVASHTLRTKSKALKSIDHLVDSCCKPMTIFVGKFATVSTQSLANKITVFAETSSQRSNFVSVT